MKSHGVAVNGRHRPDTATPVPFGEWPGADRWVPLLWIPLAFLVSAPWPIPLGFYPWFSAPLPERAVPMVFVMLAGAALIVGRLARVSWPFAALIAWATVRMLWMGISVEANSIAAGVVVMDQGHARPLQLLIGIGFVAMLYVAARGLSPAMSRLVAWAFALGAVFELCIGLLNILGPLGNPGTPIPGTVPPGVTPPTLFGMSLYPFMGHVVADQVGRPMGFLTHPNYWGNFIALSMPLVWTIFGAPLALLMYATILASRSGGPAITASVMLLVMVWPRLSARLKYLAIGGACTAITVVMTLHEWRLNGRMENWTAAWPELMRYPIIGQGLGSWRIFAEHYNGKLGKHYVELQAHSEPYQLWFELGLIGLVLVGLIIWQAWGASRKVWTDCPVGNGSWWKVGSLPLERAWLAVVVGGLVNALGSPVLHLPAQAVIILFALARVQATAADLSTQTTKAIPIRHRKSVVQKVPIT